MTDLEVLSSISINLNMQNTEYVLGDSKAASESVIIKTKELH